MKRANERMKWKISNTHFFVGVSLPQKYVPNVENKFGTNRTHTHPSANGKLKHCLYPEYNINRMKRIGSISHRIASYRIGTDHEYVVNKSIDFSVAILIISFRPIYDSFAQLFFCCSKRTSMVHPEWECQTDCSPYHIHQYDEHNETLHQHYIHGTGMKICSHFFSVDAKKWRAW